MEFNEDQLERYSRHIILKDVSIEGQQKILDRLHSEVLEFRNGLISSLRETWCRELIALQDSIEKTAEDLRQRRETLDVGQLLDTFDSFVDEIDDRLFNQGVSPIEPDSAAFDPKIQKPLSTEPTDDPDRDKTVAAVVRRGYRLEQRVLRPQIVRVYTFTRKNP